MSGYPSIRRRYCPRGEVAVVTNKLLRHHGAAAFVEMTLIYVTLVGPRVLAIIAGIEDGPVPDRSCGAKVGTSPKYGTGPLNCSHILPILNIS